MPKLDPPYEILDLADGESVTFTIQRADQGDVTIQTRLSPSPKDVSALRLHVSLADKPVGAPYWDLTAQTTIARLLPILPDLIRERRRIRLTKHGQAPLARHQLDLL